MPEENPEENLGRGKLFFEPSDLPSTILRRPPQPPQRQPPPQPPLPRLTGAGPAPRAHPLPPPRRRRCSPRPHIGSSAALPAPPPPPPPGMAQGSTSLWQQQQRGTAPWTSSSAPQVTARERRRTGRKRERRRGGGCLSRRPPRHGGVWRPLRPPLRKRPARPRAGAPVVRVSPLDPPPQHTHPPAPARPCVSATSRLFLRRRSRHAAAGGPLRPPALSPPCLRGRPALRGSPPRGEAALLGYKAGG